MARSNTQSPTPGPAGGSARQQMQQPTPDEQAELDALEAEMQALDAQTGVEEPGPLVVAPGRTLHYSGKHYRDGATVKFGPGETIPFSDEEIASGEPEKLAKLGHLVSASSAASRKLGASEATGGEGARVSTANPSNAAD